MDSFDSHTIGLVSPAVNAFSVVPSDATDFEQVTRALYVGSAGDLSVVMKGGGSVLFKNVSAGSILALRTLRVNATATTATDIVGLA
ncbi:MAG: hypothetical protein COA62_06615 [Rhodobiaceae bacterium]|nr:MAG: hypothetical protein COA62_06615 [Rhodobiaceae bacterium]